LAQQLHLAPLKLVDCGASQPHVHVWRRFDGSYDSNRRAESDSRRGMEASLAGEHSNLVLTLAELTPPSYAAPHCECDMVVMVCRHKPVLSTLPLASSLILSACTRLTIPSGHFWGAVQG
jgi:hypothetical protein